MYFVPIATFRSLERAGFQPDPRTYGTGRVGDAIGILINPDATTLAEMQTYVPEAFGREARIVSRTDETGFWICSIQDEDAVAPEESEATAVDEVADTPEGPRAPRRTHQQRRRTPRAPRQTRPELREIPLHRADIHGRHSADYVLAQVQQRYASKLARPVRAYRNVTSRPDRPLNAGLPAAGELPDDAFLVLLSVVPGNGPVSELGSHPLNYATPINDGQAMLTVPAAEAPAGMAPLKVNDTLVGAYDRNRMILFTEEPALIAYAIPAWLENFVETADTSVDTGMVHELARHRGNRQGNDASRMMDYRRELTQIRRRIRGLESEIAALQAHLANHPADFDTDAFCRQVLAIARAGIWTVDANRGDVIFTLADRRVPDPRGGPDRWLPEALQLHLGSWLNGRGPFARVSGTALVHPRVFAGHFLDGELAGAIDDMLNAGDIQDALELAQNALTSFSETDEDVTILDEWRIAEPETEAA